MFFFAEMFMEFRRSPSKSRKSQLILGRQIHLGIHERKELRIKIRKKNLGSLLPRFGIVSCAAQKRFPSPYGFARSCVCTAVGCGANSPPRFRPQAAPCAVLALSASRPQLQISLRCQTSYHSSSIFLGYGRERTPSCWLRASTASSTPASLIRKDKQLFIFRCGPLD